MNERGKREREGVTHFFSVFCSEWNVVYVDMFCCEMLRKCERST